MNNHNDTMAVVLLSPLLWFELNQRDALVNFMLFLITLNILKRKLSIACLVGSFFYKIVQRFWKSTVEQAWLVKPGLNWSKFQIQIFFYCFTKDYHIFSYSPVPQENPLTSASRYINNSVIVYLFLNSEL